jgi:hypothetical protein
LKFLAECRIKEIGKSVTRAKTHSTQGKSTDKSAPVLDFDFCFSVSRFVSNFELRISDFDPGTIGVLA